MKPWKLLLLACWVGRIVDANKPLTPPMVVVPTYTVTPTSLDRIKTPKSSMVDNIPSIKATELDIGPSPVIDRPVLQDRNEPGVRDQGQDDSVRILGSYAVTEVSMPRTQTATTENLIELLNRLRQLPPKSFKSSLMSLKSLHGERIRTTESPIEILNRQRQEIAKRRKLKTTPSTTSTTRTTSTSTTLSTTTSTESTTPSATSTSTATTNTTANTTSTSTTPTTSTANTTAITTSSSTTPSTSITATSNTTAITTFTNATSTTSTTSATSTASSSTSVTRTTSIDTSTSTATSVISTNTNTTSTTSITSPAISTTTSTTSTTDTTTATLLKSSNNMTSRTSSSWPTETSTSRAAIATNGSQLVPANTEKTNFLNGSSVSTESSSTIATDEESSSYFNPNLLTTTLTYSSSTVSDEAAKESGEAFEWNKDIRIAVLASVLGTFSLVLAVVLLTFCFCRHHWRRRKNVYTTMEAQPPNRYFTSPGPPVILKHEVAVQPETKKYSGGVNIQRITEL